MSAKRYLSSSEHATRQLGISFGQALDQSMLIHLSGTLGAGKTRFVQAVAMGLGIPAQTVQSPTFTLMTPHVGRMTLVHVDAYRINDLDEVQQLGLDDWLQADCVTMVEWAEKIEDALPKPDLVITIEHVDQDARLFLFSSDASAGQQLLAKLDSLFTATGSFTRRKK